MTFERQVTRIALGEHSKLSALERKFSTLSIIELECHVIPRNNIRIVNEK